MTREELAKDHRAIAFGQRAARDVDKLLDLYHFAAIALQRWPRTLRALEQEQKYCSKLRERIVELEGRLP